MKPTLTEYFDTHVAGCNPQQLRLELELGGSLPTARYIVDRYRDKYPSAVLEETAVSEVIENLDKWFRNTTFGQTAGTNNGDQSAPRIEPLTLEQVKRGDYVTYGPSRVMVIDRIGDDTVVLEDPFHPKGTYPIEVGRGDFSSKVMKPTEEYVKSEYVRMKMPLPEYFEQSDAERTAALAVKDREYLIKQIKEGISALIGAKRTTANTRWNLGKWFSELAETYGGELKKAVSEFAKQHGESRVPSYTTVQSWAKFYLDFKDTPEEQLPVTRDAARKVNPAWTKADKAPPAPAKASTSAAAKNPGKREKDKGQKARDAKRKQLAQAGGNGAHKTKVVELGPDGGRPAADGAAVARLLQEEDDLEDEPQSDMEEQVTDTFFKAAEAMYECCGWMPLVYSISEQLTNEEIEQAVEFLSKVIHSATPANAQIDVAEADAVSEV